jgi:zinc protease
MMGLQTRTEKTEEAITLLRKTLHKYIEEGPSAAELKASKQNITGGFPLRLDSNAKIIGNLAVIGFYELPLDYLDTFNRQVEAVSVKDIRDAFRRRIDPDDLVTVTVGSGTTN